MKITSKKLKKIGYWIAGISLVILIGGSMFPVSITVSEAQLNDLAAKKLPMTINKDIKIPLTKKIIPVTAIIENAHIGLANNVGGVKTNGSLIYKDKTVRFTAYVDVAGNNLYYDNDKYAFFASPNHINVELNKEDMGKLLKPLEKEVKKTAKEVSTAVTEKPIKKEGFFSRMKNKFSKNKEEEKLATIEINSDSMSVNIKKGLFDKFAEAKAKAKAKTKEIADKVLQEDLVAYLEIKLKDVVEYSIKKGLKTYPVYKFKDKEIDNTAKLFLSGVSIDNGELVIEFSMVNILKMILTWIMIMLFIAAFLYLLTKGGLIEVVAFVALDGI